jgi:hypothetical protein
MSVSDNYGARWVKAIFNWTRLKTQDGYQKEILIRDALIECGLRKNKTIEIMNEFIEMGLMKERKGLYYWGDTAPVNPKMKPYLDAKKKLKEDEKKDGTA